MGRRAIIVVLDGLGIGALPDVADGRPRDVGARSLQNALAVSPARLPFLSRLGLALAAPCRALEAPANPLASWGTSELGYPGADSFLGHQVLMGGDVSAVRLEPLAVGIDRYAAALRENGHSVRPVGTLPALVVDEAMLIADSLEADPGMNYNVTASLEAVSFEDAVAVASIVRELAPVPRVIAVGARKIAAEDIFTAVQTRDGIVGIDTPGLGIYDRGAEIQHLGTTAVGLDGQLAVLAGGAGMPVSLVGKMADIVACDQARRVPGVDTGLVLELLSQTVLQQSEGFIGANVQELDLAGHRRSPADYVGVLRAADEALERLVRRLDDDDLLIVAGDHGNDPTLGAQHTREAVPVLSYFPAIRPTRLGRRRTLADIGATAANWLRLPPTAVGVPFGKEVAWSIGP